MDSSDNSFVWTSASSMNASNDSDSMLDQTMNGVQDDEESESDKSYKRKLRKQLSMKRESEAAQTPPASPPPPPPPGARVKHEASDCKAEYPEQIEIKKIHTSSKSHSSDDDTTLKRLVKEETRKHKSRKLRKKRYSELMDYDGEDTVIEDKFSAEDTVVQTPKETVEMFKKESNFKTKNSYPSKEFVSDESSSDERAVRENTKVNGHNRAHSSKHKRARAREREGSGSDGDHLANGINFIKKNVATPSDCNEAKVSRQTQKISHLIQFEDDEDLILNKNASFDKRVRSSELKRFVKSKPHLKSVTPHIQNDSSITRDDDIWVLKCPSEMDVMSMSNAVLSLDNKCKIKINGQTFIGNIDEEKSRVTVLSFEHDNAALNNLSSAGTIYFRKRIPKAHIMEDDNIMVNNQTNFIPLPNTKIRHPLFGPDYKKAMKIPTHIKTRLKASDIDPVKTFLETKKKKKKHKKEKSPAVEIKAEPDERPRRRADKRERPRGADDDDDAHTQKKKKRLKHYFVPAEAWESEKAIEENLFNF